MSSPENENDPQYGVLMSSPATRSQSAKARSFHQPRNASVLHERCDNVEANSELNTFCGDPGHRNVWEKQVTNPGATRR